MSGYVLNLLVPASTRDDAIGEAIGFLDHLWENGDLVEGDHGHVQGLDGDERDYSKAESVIVGKDEPERLLAEIRKLQGQRAASARDYLTEALARLAEAKVSVLDVLPEEQGGPQIVGHCFYAAGQILAGYWTPRAVLYDADRWNGGVNADRLGEIEAAPEKFALVEVCVG